MFKSAKTVYVTNWINMCFMFECIAICGSLTSWAKLQVRRESLERPVPWRWAWPRTHTLNNDRKKTNLKEQVSHFSIKISVNAETFYLMYLVLELVCGSWHWVCPGRGPGPLCNLHHRRKTGRMNPPSNGNRQNTNRINNYKNYR